MDASKRPGLDAEASFDGSTYYVHHRSQRMLVFGENCRPTNAIFMPILLLEPVAFLSDLSDQMPPAFLTPDVAIAQARKFAGRQEARVIGSVNGEVTILCAMPDYLGERAERIIVLDAERKLPRRIEFRATEGSRPYTRTEISWQVVKSDDGRQSIPIPVKAVTELFDPKTGEQVGRLVNEVSAVNWGKNALREAELEIDFGTAESIFDDGNGVWIRQPDDGRTPRTRPPGSRPGER